MRQVTALGVATQREGGLADPTLMLRALEILIGLLLASTV